MVWTATAKQGRESDKIAAIAVPYLQGERVLDVGCGTRKVWPSLIGIDNGKEKRFNYFDVNIMADGYDLSFFSDASVDAVFSSHLLEHFPKEVVPDVLNEWSRLLKVGGHLVLYVPSANLYPKCGTDYSNPDHKWDIYPGDIEQWFEAGKVSGCWTQLEAEERGEANEYSLFLVFRKDLAAQPLAASGHGSGRIPTLRRNIWQRNPNGKQRALVIRYGAIGDTLQSMGILKHLKALGYHTTFNCTPKCQDIVRHDPYIDDWIIQATDFVPNESLGPYWEELQRRYDYVVNLCESIEGPLLALPGRLNHMYRDEARRRLVGKINYHERLHDIANVPYEFSGTRFYATEQERYRARKFKEKVGKGQPVVAWVINGSSHHKTYPFTQIAVKWLADKGVHTVLLGGKGPDQALQAAFIEVMKDNGIDVSMVSPMVGEWELRDSLAFVQVAECVVGPETGLVNAVAFDTRVAKVVYLSHSSHDNLTKHWVNTTVLTPSKCPCYPCHRLHYNWDHCNKVEETQAALCATQISPTMVFEAVMKSLGGVKLHAA